jgi:hypothetical protein
MDGRAAGLIRGSWRLGRGNICARLLVATFLGITPGVAIYAYFGIFGYGLNKGPGALDWVFLGLGVVATIVLGIVVTRKTRELFKAFERRRG